MLHFQLNLPRSQTFAPPSIHLVIDHLEANRPSRPPPFIATQLGLTNESWRTGRERAACELRICLCRVCCRSRDRPKWPGKNADKRGLGRMESVQTERMVEMDQWKKSSVMLVL